MGTPFEIVNLDEFNLSSQLTDLIFVGLSHGIETAESTGGPIIPFVLFEVGGERNLVRYLAGTIEESLSKAYEAVKGCDSDRAVIVFDGYVTLDGAKSDAVLVKGQERSGEAVMICHRYRTKKRLGRKFQLEGNPVFMGATEALYGALGG